MFGKVGTGDKATSAIALESDIRKSGYLIKQAVKSASNWKRRYFVLNGSSLTYYQDHKHVKTAKGDILLTSDATVEEFSEGEYQYGFEVKTPFMTLRLSCVDGDERDEWTNSIRNIILELSKMMRGYLLKQGKFLEGAWVRKFFILHNDTLTYHDDHLHTSKISGVYQLSSDAIVETDDQFSITIKGKKRFIIKN